MADVLKACRKCGTMFKASRQDYTVNCPDCRRRGASGGGGGRRRGKYPTIKCSRCGTNYSSLRCPGCGF